MKALYAYRKIALADYSVEYTDGEGSLFTITKEGSFMFPKIQCS